MPAQTKKSEAQASGSGGGEKASGAFGVDSTGLEFEFPTEGDGLLSPEARRAVSGVLLAKAKARVQAGVAAKKQWGGGWRDPRETGDIEIIPVDQSGERRGSGDSAAGETPAGSNKTNSKDSSNPSLGESAASSSNEDLGVVEKSAEVVNRDRPVKMKTAFLVDIAGDNRALKVAGDSKVDGKRFHIDPSAGDDNVTVVNGVAEKTFTLQELAEAGCLHGQWSVPLEHYDAKRNTSSPHESKHHDRVTALLGRLRAASAKDSAAEKENGTGTSTEDGVYNLEQLLDGAFAGGLKKLRGAFAPDAVGVSFENVNGRVISERKTLCGWSYDADLANNHTTDRTTNGKMWDWKAGGGQGKWSDLKQSYVYPYVGDGTPKLFVNLGRATVSWGFKYDKNDNDENMLTVDLDPGDVLVRAGESRSWCSACIGIYVNAECSEHAPKPGDMDYVSEEQERRDFPFDFCQLKVMDLRRFGEDRGANAWRKMAGVGPAKMRDAEKDVNQWFQYALEYVGYDEETGEKDVVRVKNTARLAFTEAAAEKPSPAPEMKTTNQSLTTPEMKTSKARAGSGGSDAKSSVGSTSAGGTSERQLLTSDESSNEREEDDVDVKELINNSSGAKVSNSRQIKQKQKGRFGKEKLVDTKQPSSSSTDEEATASSTPPNHDPTPVENRSISSKNNLGKGSRNDLQSNKKSSLDVYDQDVQRFSNLIPLLEIHMADDKLIKGWEADKRIFKDGKSRAPLRAAARDIRIKSVKANTARMD